MKKKFRLAAIAMAFVLMFGTASSFACSAVYVGKDVSTDGSTIIARSEDQGTGAYNKMFLVVDRVENVKGRTHDDIQGFSYPLPATTYKYTMVPDASDAGDGVYAGAATNEYGLSISATVSAYPRPEVEKVDPFVEGGLREAALTGLLAATCKTPKEAIQKLAEIYKKYGSEEGNVILLANKDEAWNFEVYSGHLWAAKKLDTDKVAVFGNMFMIDEVEPVQSENFMFQEDLFKIADENKWTVKTNGKVNLAATFGEKPEDYSNMRTWMGHKLLAPDTVGDYETGRQYPFLYTPSHKVSALEVMDVLRSRFEGTRLDASLPGNEGLRVIGVERQSQIHVIQIKDSYPQEIGALQWLAMGNAEHSVFIPNFSGITDTYSAYKVDGMAYNPDGAYWKYKRICGLAEQDRNFFGKGVRDYWKLYETSLYDSMQNAEKTMIKYYGESPEKAKKYVTDLHMKLAAKGCKDADHLYDQLLLFMMDKNNGRANVRQTTAFVADIAVRDAAAAKGYTVSWAGKGKPLVLTKGADKYTFTIGEKKCYVTKNGKTAEVEMQFAPKLEKGTTYIPMDIVATM